MDWAIVAVPEESDRVHKRSSEKVPHITLLYFGEQDDPEAARHVAQQLQHTVNTSLTSFGLEVDRRGTLGPKNADVLFFEKNKQCKKIDEFRSLLLQDAVIRGLYDSTEQYPEWTPHLTLGYPETPAVKPTEDWDDDTPRYVHFDKIEFWVEDYEGPSFDLSYEPGFSKDVATERAPYDMSMSEDSPATVTHQSPTYMHVPSGDTKGLLVGGRSRSYIRPVMEVLGESLQHTLNVMTPIVEDETFLAHAEAGELATGTDIREKYDRIHQRELLAQLAHAVGGRQSEMSHIRYDITPLPDNDWLISTINTLEHTGTAETRVHPYRNEHGLIEEFIVIAANVSEADLPHAIRHYGVKGMKWGVRRKASALLSSAGAAARAKRSSMAEARAVKKDIRDNEKYMSKVAKSEGKIQKKQDREIAKNVAKDEKKQARRDNFKRPVTEDAVAAAKGRDRAGKHGTDALSNKDLQSLVTRMNLEQQLANLKANEKAAKARNSGRTYLNDLMKDAGKTLVNEAASYAAQEGMKYAFDKAGQASANRRENRENGANRRDSVRVGPPEVDNRRRLALPRGR